MNTPTHIYISGPMRGHRGYNFPAFFAAEEYLSMKWPDADICNPAREDVMRFNLHNCLHTDPTGLTAGLYFEREPNLFTHDSLREALGSDLAYIIQHADLIVVLTGWEKSKGAAAEAATAVALGTPVIEFKAEEVHVPETALRGGDAPEWLPEALPSADRDPAEEEWWEAQRGRSVGRSVPPGGTSGETISISATGGAKGTKLAAFDQVSPEVELLVAEHFGKGARKYEAHNFRKGYEWSKSYSALRRHLAAFWAGEEYDNHLPTCPEGCAEHTESLHIVAVIWHAMVLTEFYLHHKEYDDRYGY